MKEYDPSRRHFAQALMALTGVCAAEALIPIETKINQVAAKATKQYAGNAKARQFPDKTKLSETEKRNLIVKSPLVEEICFRAIPSGAVSLLEHREDTVADIFIGTGVKAAGLGLSRREMFAGIASSLTFGISHNLAAGTSVAETIPASQTLYGLVSWYIQRKLGLITGLPAHIWHNWRIFT